MNHDNHSPGPWELDSSRRIWSPGDKLVADLRDVQELSEADARLIADAPETKREHGEMLDLLRTFSRAHPHDQPHMHLGKDEAAAEAQCLICKVGKLLSRIDARKANP